MQYERTLPKCKCDSKWYIAIKTSSLEVAERETGVAKQIVLAVAVVVLLGLLRFDVVVAGWRDTVCLHRRIVRDVAVQMGLVALSGCGVIVLHL